MERRWLKIDVFLLFGLNEPGHNLPEGGPDQTEDRI